MEKFEFIRHETPKKQIEFCLESFDKKEAVKRICQWIEDTMDNVEMQIKNYESMHHVSECIHPYEFVERDIITEITHCTKCNQDII